MSKHYEQIGRSIGRRAVIAGTSALAGATILGRLPQAAAPGCGVSSGSTGSQALMADQAANLPGVNTHINYLGTVYDRSYSSIIKPRLLELGVRHIRDNPGSDGNVTVKSRYIDLARSGVKLLLITWDTSNNDIDYVTSLNSSGVQVVEAVEPPNERDNGWGSGMPTQMRSYMMAMYARYKGNSATKNITVLGPSFAKTRDAPAQLTASFSNASSYMDRGNAHNYCGREPEGAYGGGWGISLSDALSRQRLGSSKSVWATENGYKMSLSANGHSAVTQRAAAKYLPRQFLSHLQRGASKFYIYQLINNNLEDFGLLNDNGTPRLQFNAVKNFIALFKDPGADFTPGTLRYSLSGDLSGIQRLLLQKRNGRFYLAVWQGVQSSKIATSDSGIGDIEYPRRQLTLSLGLKMKAATIYEPSFSGSPIKSYANAAGLTSVPLSVPDHVQVIELIPAGCA